MLSPNISSEQEKVVFETENNVLLVAPPGTGKTTTLTNRISHILQNNITSPEEILCITFTNKASKDLKTKIHEQIQGASKITVNTIHGFCYTILQDEARENTDMFADFTIYDTEDSMYLLHNLLVNKLKKPYADYVKLIHDFIYKIKHRRADYDFYSVLEDKNNEGLMDYRKTIKKFHKEELEEFNNYIKLNKSQAENTELAAFLLYDGAELITAYNEELRLARAVDFVDLILGVYELFLNPEISEKYRKKYQFINIDEVQDTSLLEYRIISKIFYGNNIFLSGDINQTIYEWRGSSPDEIINRYREDFKPVEITLTKTFRSSGPLVNLWDAMRYDFLKNKNSESEEPLLEENDKQIIELFCAENITSEAVHIYNRIKILINEENRDNTDFCILTRTNVYNRYLSDELRKIKNQDANAIPYDFMLIDEFNSFKGVVIKDIIAFMKLALNPFDEVSFSRIIPKYISGIKGKPVDDFVTNGIRITDFLRPDTFEYNDPFGLLIDNYKANNIIVFDVETTGTDTDKDDIIQIAAIKIDNSGKVIEKFDRFITTEFDLTETSLVHGFTNEFIKENGENAEKVLEEFKEFVNNSVLIGHNVNFDISMVKNNLKRNNMNGIEIKGYYDTLDLYRRFYKGLKNYKLSTLSEIFNVTANPDHNAYNDILATAELLIIVYEEHIINNMEFRKNHVELYAHFFKKIADFICELSVYTETKPSYEIAEIIATKIREIDNKKHNASDLIKISTELYDKNLSNYENLKQLINISSLSNSELDMLIKKSKKIPIITVHQAKGLEYSIVFIAGLMDDIFPMFTAIKNKKLREEKRLLYVAFTRAKENLYLSYSKTYNGYNKNISRFLNELARYVKTLV